MTRILLYHNPGPAKEPCALCGQETSAPAGPQLVLADGLRLVCVGCGKRHLPPLAALLNLADEAHRVGRIGRHSVFPPYTALLDLARAADAYASSLLFSREAG